MTRHASWLGLTLSKHTTSDLRLPFRNQGADDRMLWAPLSATDMAYIYIHACRFRPNEMVACT